MAPVALEMFRNCRAAHLSAAFWSFRSPDLSILAAVSLISSWACSSIPLSITPSRPKRELYSAVRTPCRKYRLRVVTMFFSRNGARSSAEMNPSVRSLPEAIHGRSTPSSVWGRLQSRSRTPSERVRRVARDWATFSAVNTSTGSFWPVLAALFAAAVFHSLAMDSSVGRYLATSMPVNLLGSAWIAWESHTTGK